MRTPVRILAAGAIACSAVAFTGCTSGPEPKNETKRETLAIDSEAALKRMQAQDASLKDFLDRSYGYAIFPSIGKGGLGIGGTYGRGEVDQGGRHVGYADVTAISAGLLAGGQTLSELIVFGTEDAYNKFTRGEWGFGANAAVVAMKAGAAKTAQFKDGVVTFVDTRGGLMGDLSLEGQKFRYKAMSGSGPTTARTAGYEDRQNEARQAQDRQAEQQQRDLQQQEQNLQQQQRDLKDQQKNVEQRSEELRDQQRDAQPAAEPQPADRDPAIRGEVEIGKPQGTSGQAGETK